MPGRLFAAVVLLAAAQAALATGPVVVANRTKRDITGTVSTVDGPPRRVTVARGDLTVLTVSGGATVSYISNSKLQTTRVVENSAYAFTGAADGLSLEPLYAAPEARGREKPAAEGAVVSPPVGTITVKIMVDGQEPDKDWQTRLRKRIAAASAVLERQCRVRLEVTDVGTWESSAEARSFDDQLNDFSRRVVARPAFVVIGFSSRRLPVDPNAKTVAPLPVPLEAHVLIGEWFPMGETQRLEVLLHELGHFLGAVHTKDADSVMRINSSDGRSMEKDFRIGYDPLNALAISLVSREALKVPPARKLGALTASTRTQLTQLYKELARLLPEDAAPERYLRLLEEAPPPARVSKSADPLVGGARTVVAAVVSAAEAGAELRLTGDRRTEHCVRAAAAAAGKLPDAQRVPAFLLGLAVAVDTSDLLRKAAPTRALWEKVESDAERSERLKVVGEPTLHGRHDLARHFAVAAALTSVAGSRAADAGGLVRELFEPEEGSGFRFAELAVDYAGAALARMLARDPERLSSLAASFSVEAYVPSPDGLDETLSREEFARRYGSFSDERFRQREREVRGRVAELSGYRRR